MFQDAEQPRAALWSRRLARWLIPFKNLEGTRQQVTEAVVIGVTTISLLILLATAIGLQVMKLVALVVTRLEGAG
jgi:hypothetical protein